jgi:hypothetical protein
MRPFTLQALTWTTVAAAVGSALWLAAAESAQPVSAWRPGFTPPSFSDGGAHVVTVSLESTDVRGKHRAPRDVPEQR